MPVAVVATGFGGPEHLSVIDVEVGEPGPGEVAVDVRAAGVNPIDVKRYGGGMGADPSQLPMRLGYETAGVVRAVGPDAVGPAGPVSVGDEVIAYSVPGGYAETLLAPATSVLPRPPELSWEQAAGLMLTGVTAVHLVRATRIGAGDTVLVHGASGGVGLMAVQLAAARGARVIGTARPANADLLRELGAEPVAYGDGLAGRVRDLAPDGVDVALDTVGTDEAVDVSLELVADRARVATIAAFARGAAENILVLGGGPGGDPGTELRNAARLDLVRRTAEGRLRVLVATTYPLREAAAAHTELMGGHAPGKIILVP